MGSIWDKLIGACQTQTRLGLKDLDQNIRSKAVIMSSIDLLF